MIRVIHSGDCRFYDGKFYEPGQTYHVDHLTDAMRRAGLKPITAADRADAMELSAEQAREKYEEIADRYAALESEAAVYKVRLEEHPKEIARLEKALDDTRAERDSAVADMQRAQRAAQLLEDQMSTGSAVDRPWIDSDDLTSWVNEQRKAADADADPFTGKYAKTRALAWCATQGDVACANLWAESHKG